MQGLIADFDRVVAEKRFDLELVELQRIGRHQLVRFYSDPAVLGCASGNGEFLCMMLSVLSGTSIVIAIVEHVCPVAVVTCTCIHLYTTKNPF